MSAHTLTFQSAFKTWAEASKFAWAYAYATKQSLGICKPGYDGMWTVCMLPKKENRYGRYLQCEAVDP